MSGICVFGSLNIDLTVRLERFHVPGETVVGRSFHTFTGGKGGNQAVAAARLGGEARMIGCLGDDANVIRIRDNCRRFDPTNYLELHQTLDPVAHIGIRMVMAMVREATYVNPLGLNNLTLVL